MFHDPATKRLSDFIVPADLHSLDVGQQFRAVQLPEDGSDFTVAAGFDWYGPYTSVERAKRECDEHGLDKGLVLVLGKNTDRSAKSQSHRLQLVAKRVLATFIDEIAALDRLDSQSPVEIWLGNPHHLPVDMQGSNQQEPDLWQSKWVWVKALQPPLNEKMTVGPPERRVVVRNYFGGVRDSDDDSLFWLPDIIDFPYRKDERNQNLNIDMYWTDQRGNITVRKSVNANHGQKPQSDGRNPIAGEKAKRRRRTLTYAVLWPALAAALVALAYLWLQQDDTESGPGVEAVRKEMQALLDATDAEIKELQTKLAELKTEIEERIGRAETLEEDLAARDAEIAELQKRLGEAPATEVVIKEGGGLDHPPCWTRGESKQPDYLFTATISSVGIRLDKAFTAHDDAAYTQLPTADVPLGDDLSIGQFRAAVEPIYFASVGAECRHFVRMVDGDHSNVEVYKAQRKAVEDNFYIYRPL